MNAQKPSRIFISHSSKDKDFVRGLVAGLQSLHYNIWLDEWEIAPGDSILTKIFDGLESSDTVAVVLSTASVKSRWVNEELTATATRRIADANVRLMPILIEDCDIPASIRHLCYADFRHDFEAGFGRVLDAVAPMHRQWDTLKHLEELFSITCEKVLEDVVDEQHSKLVIKLNQILESALDLRYEIEARLARRMLMNQSFFDKIEKLKESGIDVRSETWNTLVHIRSLIAHNMRGYTSHYGVWIEMLRERYKSGSPLEEAILRLKKIMSQLCTPR